ncbi:MAG: peptidylprolyl isomerase [Gammaproteobacteria bacterium]|nr:peptidylprolyl isomerase [Gammaproteobacteria bacterium]MDH5801273.1 peptidylprolyl isomerase [Gammaproteobacteria bacterium]
MDSRKLFINLVSFFVATGVFIGGKLAHSADLGKDVMAVVNGKKITLSTYDSYIKQRGLPKDLDPTTQRDMVLNELINRELIYQDALQKKVDKSQNIRTLLENARQNIIAGEMLRKTTEEEIPKKTLQTEYENFIKTLNNREFKASHILLSDKKTAEDVIAELKKGGNFQKLAKEKSTGPSGPMGGDLGWFRSEQMVKPFADAVANMKKGTFSETPVNTQFGWHVILLEDSRATDTPKFEDMEDQLRMRVQNKSVESYINSLRKKAKIKTR